MKLQKISPSDYHELARMASEIWNAHYIQIITQEQINYMLDKMYSEPALTQQTEEGQQFYFILNNENQRIGFISFTNQGGGHYFLHKFYLLGQEQAKGYGEKLFKEWLNLTEDLKSVRLTVNRQNFKSVNFYFKLGFKIEKCEDFDIGSGYFMNDFVMKYSSQKPAN